MTVRIASKPHYVLDPKTVAKFGDKGYREERRRICADAKPYRKQRYNTKAAAERAAKVIKKVTGHDFYIHEAYDMFF